jgi:3',5'-cyclic AMP phosphodiesterase CpdA
VPAPHLLATSDLHVAYPENRERVERLRPRGDDDWLIVAGDVGEIAGDVEWALTLLSKRFARVIWVPGNHELWTTRDDPVRLRGEERYRYLVQMCRRIGVTTPEDEYPLWTGPGGPAVVVPLFVLYDYSFRDPSLSREQAMALAHETGIVCTDEYLLDCAPYASAAHWCAARLEATERRLAALPADVPTVLVNHFPLVRKPTSILRYPIFAQWCGTERTADWHTRFRASVVVYGHLHIPLTTWHDGVRFEEVSVGYPREHRVRGITRGLLRQILPAPESPG